MGGLLGSRWYSNIPFFQHSILPCSQLLMRHLSILIHYFSQYLKARLAYKGDFLIAVFTSFSATVASFGFLYILFHRVSSLQGWKFEERSEEHTSELQSRVDLVCR